MARADFYGDALISQLSFRKDTLLEVDLSGSPQNGWRWGVCRDGSRGWLPHWAVKPLTPPVECISYESPSRRRSKKLFVAPLACIAESGEGEGEGEGDCFDQRNNNNNNNNNDALEGNIPRARTADGRRDEVEERSSAKNNSSSSSSRNRGTEDSQPKSKKRSNLFRKSSKVDRSNSNSNSNSNSSSGGSYTNPYTQKQDQLEWDGCEVPQITSDADGRVATFHADGRTSHYQNENSYRTAAAAATNQILEQVSITTKQTGHRLVTKSQAVGRQISEFRMPTTTQRKNSSSDRKTKTNTNANANANTKTPTESTTNNENNGRDPQPKPKKFSKMKALLPRVPSCRKNLGGLLQPSRASKRTTTPYFDAYGNEQTIVKEQRRSSRTRLDIHY